MNIFKTLIAAALYRRSRGIADDIRPCMGWLGTVVAVTGYGNNGWGNDGWGDGMGDDVCDGDFGFNMSGSGSGRGQRLWPWLWPWLWRYYYRGYGGYGGYPGLWLWRLPWWWLWRLSGGGYGGYPARLATSGSGSTCSSGPVVSKPA